MTVEWNAFNASAVFAPIIQLAPQPLAALDLLEYPLRPRGASGKRRCAHWTCLVRA
jgi:hypothetical protein